MKKVPVDISTSAGKSYFIINFSSKSQIEKMRLTMIASGLVAARKVKSQNGKQTMWTILPTTRRIIPSHQVLLHQCARLPASAFCSISLWPIFYIEKLAVTRNVANVSTKNAIVAVFME